jgi:histidinol-phosphatase (PHP family)
MNTADKFFNETENWYQEEIKKTLLVIKDNNAIIEINTRGLYKNKWHTSFPSPEILKMSNKLNIPIVISSDAHSITELSGAYNIASKIALDAGYKHQMMFENGKWIEINLK